MILFKLMQKMLSGHDVREDLKELGPRLASMQMEHAYIMETENSPKTMFMKYMVQRLNAMLTEMSEKMTEKMEESNKTLMEKMIEKMDEKFENMNKKMEDDNKKLKDDIENLRKDMKDDIENLRKDMKDDNKKLRKDMNKKFRKMNKKMNESTKKLEKDMKDGFETLRTEMKDDNEMLRDEMEDKNQELSNRIEETNGRLTDYTESADTRIEDVRVTQQDLPARCETLENEVEQFDIDITRLNSVAGIVHAEVYNLQYRHYNREQQLGDTELLLPRKVRPGLGAVFPNVQNGPIPEEAWPVGSVPAVDDLPDTVDEIENMSEGKIHELAILYNDKFGIEDGAPLADMRAAFRNFVMHGPSEDDDPGVYF